MADITSFKGYMYNTEKIDNLGLVMSPPYDALLPELQDDLYSQHEYNAIRLSKGKRFDTDTDTDNVFTRSRDFLDDWLKKDIIVQDDTPAIYLYEQEVEFNGYVYTNKGFVTLLKLEEFGNHVLTCEDTTPINKTDRYELLAKTKANFNMINGLYIESEKFLSHIITEIKDTEPDVSFVLPDGAKDKLWRITDSKKIEFIINAIKPHTIYIADGQNRYETALKYQAECKKNNPNHNGNEPYNYIMTLLTNAYDESLMLLPFHRMVKFKKPFNESFFIAACQDYFKVEKIIVDLDTSNFVDTIKKQIVTTRNENKIALYCGGEYFYRLTLKPEVSLKDWLPDKSDAYLGLDVTVLNKLILEDILNISEDDQSENITYTKSITEGIQFVKENEYGCFFAINPVKTYQIHSITSSGEKFPAHSICIFPKPATGVLFNLI